MNRAGRLTSGTTMASRTADAKAARRRLDCISRATPDQRPVRRASFVAGAKRRRTRLQQVSPRIARWPAKGERKGEQTSCRREIKKWRLSLFLSRVINLLQTLDGRANHGPH